MSEVKDIRWKQRFQNFERAFTLLDQAIKDYLEAEGFTIASPRDALKQAYQAHLIENGHIWIDALQDRNLTTHTYDEATAIAVENKIRQFYYPILAKLYQDFKGRIVQ
jgi:nucleotidyltransferase substrate binding protein (TIGR01987 family)